LAALVSSGAVHNLVLAEAADLLATAYEPIPMGRLGEEAAGEPAWSAQPVFAQEDGAFGAFFNRAVIDHAQTLDDVPALTAAQTEVLDLIDEVTTRPALQLRHVLQEGEVMFLNNTQVLHSRTGFDDHDEPDERRHLFRLWWGAPRLAALVPRTVRYPYRFGRTGLTPAEVAAAAGVSSGAA
ncbi:MAG TPA: TauD/TfdA family dioxygenase, partial [Iamia sp.]|nr:TauD/TfdA family dioxygenase [Iamia sp.]